MKTIFSLLTVCGLLAMPAFAGTQTENYGISVLPAPGRTMSVCGSGLSSS